MSNHWLKPKPTNNMNTTIINLTPHTLNIGGVTIPPSGQVARVSVTRVPCGKINGIPCFVPSFGDVEGLPAASDDTIFVVSALVRNHPEVASRTDVASPGQPVRDEEGRIIGCDGLDFNA